MDKNAGGMQPAAEGSAEPQACASGCPASEEDNARAASPPERPEDMATAEAPGQPDAPQTDAPEAVPLAQLPRALQEACARAGWTMLTPAQSLSLPALLAGRDIMVQSRTGSGKTGCYLLPMLESLDANAKFPQALILVPTRELALQVEREAETLLSQSGLAACALYGGTGYKKQLDGLAKGAQVIVATPGRALDHILRQTLRLNGLKMLVFDEADRMLSIGFYPDMLAIAGHLPKKRQTAMFSATYPPHVLKLAKEFMRCPEMISLSRKQVHVAEVEHLFCEVKPMDRDRALVRLLETENPSSALIFCNTRADVHYLAGVLQGFGYRAEELSSDLPQKKREAVLEHIREGSCQYVVATDVAARGIDIPDLSHVFLWQPPEDHESYIHRAGRTGRAGAAGTVISLVDVMQRLELERISRHYRISLRQIPVPDDDAVAATVCMRLNTLLESRLRALTGLERMRANRYLPLARQLAAPEADDDENALAILAMLLDDCHRQSLNEARHPAATAAKQPSRESGKKSGRRRAGKKRE